jgi:hypothetical protein
LRTAVDTANLTIRSGEVFGLLGSNTTVRVIANYRRAISEMRWKSPMKEVLLRKKLITVIFAFSVAAAAAIGLAPTANAWTGCYAAGCNGKWATTEGCDADAQFLQSVNAGAAGTIELWWSPACQANYAYYTGALTWYNRYYRTENSAGYKAQVTLSAWSGTEGDTPMVNGHNIAARACGGTVGSAPACTGWH